MYLKDITSAMALLAQCTLALTSPLQARQYMDSYPGPFYLETRNQDVSNGQATYNYMDLTQVYNGSVPLPKAYAVSGEGSIFHLSNGVLSTQFAYTNGNGDVETVKWKNTPVRGNRRLEFRPVSVLARPGRPGTMFIEAGTHVFLSPGGNYTESDWTLCQHQDGTDYGLAVGDVPAKGVTCGLVYVFLVPPQDS